MKENLAMPTAISVSNRIHFVVKTNCSYIYTKNVTRWRNITIYVARGRGVANPPCGRMELG
jgi:hypothetical protein